MKTYKAVVVGRSVTVDTKKNDIVDIRAGGPSYLGYDFIVDASENPKEIESFIKNIFSELNESYLNIWISPNTMDVFEESIWDKEKIKHCIVNEKL